MDTYEDKPFSEPYDHPGTVRTLAVLDEVVIETGATRNQVVLAWLLASGVSPIVGGSRVEYVDEAMDALAVDLTVEQIERLGSARQRRLPAPAASRIAVDAGSLRDLPVQQDRARHLGATEAASRSG